MLGLLADTAAGGHAGRADMEIPPRLLRIAVDADGSGR
jgi:hypothetical protein